MMTYLRLHLYKFYQKLAMDDLDPLDLYVCGNTREILNILSALDILKDLLPRDIEGGHK